MEPKEKQKLSKRIDFVPSHEQGKSIESTFNEGINIGKTALGFSLFPQFISAAAQSEKCKFKKQNSVCSASGLLQFGINHHCSILQGSHNYTLK